MNRQLACAAFGAGFLLAQLSVFGTILGVAGDYNAFVLNDLNAIGGDTEGRLAVGHDATMQWYSVGYHSPNSYGTKDHLVVGNNLNAPGGWQVFGGNTKYGASLINSPTTVAPNTISKGTPIDFAAATTQFRDLAGDLAALPTNGSSYYQWSTLHITGTDPLLNVVTINPASWAAASDRQITAPAGSTLIINIPGLTNSMQGGLALNGIARENVLYNFYESTTMNSISIALRGSVLAPYATVNLSSGAFEGTSIVYNAIQRNGGEFHNYAFNGIPEPATGLLLLGFSVSLLCRWPRSRAR